MEYRNEIKSFAEHMEIMLKTNEYKDGWRDFTDEYLLKRLFEHFEKLKERILEGGSSILIIQEAANVANYAMFIADNTGRKFNERIAKKLEK